MNFDFSSPFLLVTHWGSWVCADPDTGHVIHIRPADCPLNFVMHVRNGITTLCGLDSDRILLSDEVSLTESVWSCEIDVPSSSVAMRVNDRLATAMPSGAFEFVALERRAWEKFQPVSLADAQRIYLSHQVRCAHTPSFLRQRRISRVIHQTYPVENLPTSYAENVALLRSNNPQYEYRLWTDQGVHDFIYDCYGYQILSEFLKINPQYGAVRADLFRYLCIYKLGGVYLDMKANSKLAFDQFIGLDDEYILSQWSNGAGRHPELVDVAGGEYQQWHVIAAPGHPFLYAVIERVLDNIHSARTHSFGVGAIAGLRLTGPIPYTLAINEKLDSFRHRFIKPIDDFLIYDNVKSHVLAFRRNYKSVKTPVVL